LAQVLAKPEFEQDELVSVVKTDSMLTAAVLRLANSPNYQRGQPVVDITRAVARIGSRQLQTLAMASGVQTAVDGPGPLASLRRRAWLEGLCSARVCEVLAQQHGEPAETAFVAGLLHDLGRMLAIATLEDILRNHPEHDSRTADEWWALADRFHLELGLVLSAHWQLPDDLVSAITEHHDPPPGESALQRIAISDEVVRLLDEKAGVSASELGSIASLSTRECEAIEQALEVLPSFIESFELDQAAEVPSKITPSSAVVPPVTEGRAVTLNGVGPLALAGHAVAFDDNQVVLVVAKSVRTNVLGRLEWSGSGSMCVRVSSCDPSGDAFVVKVSAFALSKSQQHAWQAFSHALSVPRADAPHPPPRGDPSLPQPTL
jgi:HD-like signal output (HDOD) protein